MAFICPYSPFLSGVVSDGDRVEIRAVEPINVGNSSHKSKNKNVSSRRTKMDLGRFFLNRLLTPLLTLLSVNNTKVMAEGRLESRAAHLHLSRAGQISKVFTRNFVA